MIITSVTLAVCGAYRMNRSCTAAYLTFAIFGFVMVSAVGLVIVTNETQYLQDILDRSIQQEKDKAMLDLFTRMMMIVSLVLAAFQMIGIMLGCCLMKAIDDSKSPQ
ncbi:hypothetical protein EB796_022281 [Bugula neritina]|uniref:Uncharacterized protein n=1 Tax=Bugula neritina TaxID=10212 RepID=A0A7J7J134_BUGNE|nr:hypothetical protein EB796_022281 [Bugula neritina]